LIFALLLPGCPATDDDTTTLDDDAHSDDDDTHADDDTTLSDDDSSLVLTPLIATYRCVSHAGDGSARPWYYFDPFSLIEVDADAVAYDSSEHITRTLPSWEAYCDVIWNWDLEADAFPSEPGWFVSGTVDLEVFHGIERVIVQLRLLDPGLEARCDLEPDALLQVRGGDDAEALSDWYSLEELTQTDEMPEQTCYKQWRREGEPPPWAGRYLQFRLDLTSHADSGYVQSAFPLHIEYMTTVPYYYWVINEVFTEY